MSKSDRLLPSTPDTISLSEAVTERFISVFEFHRQLKGFDLAVPESIELDLVKWRMMVGRHRKGDFRNLESELIALKEVAQWTVEQNCILRGQPIKKVVFQ